MPEADDIPAALFNDTGEDGHFGSSLVMSELRRRLALQGIRPVWRHRVGDDWRADPTALAGCGGAKLAVVNGEGTIHHAPQRARAVILSEIGPFARDRLRIPAFLVNATIFAIDSATADNLRAFTRIWVRDSASRAELAQHGIASEVVPDLTIAAAFPSAGARRGICGTDSVKAEATAAILSRCNREGWSYRPMKWLRKGEPPAAVAPTPAEFASFLASHRLVVTGRYHAVAFCLATRTPFVAVESNTPKISFLLNDAFGSTRRVVSAGEIESADLARFDEWSGAEEEALNRFLARARGQAETMAAAIRELA